MSLYEDDDGRDHIEEIEITGGKKAYRNGKIITTKKSAPVPNEPSDDIKTGKPIETSFDRTRKEVQSHEPSDDLPTVSSVCPGCVNPVSPVSSMMYCQDCQLKQNERVSAIGDERLGKLLTHLVNKNRVGPTDLREEQVIGLGFVEQYIAALIEEQTKLARIDEQQRTSYFRYDNGDVEITFDGSDIDSIRQEDRIAYLEASIKERGDT